MKSFADRPGALLGEHVAAGVALPPGRQRHAQEVDDDRGRARRSGHAAGWPGQSREPHDLCARRHSARLHGVPERRVGEDPRWAVGPLPDVVVAAAPHEAGRPTADGSRSASGRGRSSCRRGSRPSWNRSRSAYLPLARPCPSRRGISRRRRSAAPSGSRFRRKCRTPYGSVSVISVGPWPANRVPTCSSSASRARGASHALEYARPFDHRTPTAIAAPISVASTGVRSRTSPRRPLLRRRPGPARPRPSPWRSATAS